jgi:methanogenic corrinoid protein MtbC1
MVGGAPVLPEWAKEIGADGYGESAMEAVRTAKKLVGLQSVEKGE